MVMNGYEGVVEWDEGGVFMEFVVIKAQDTLRSATS